MYASAVIRAAAAPSKSVLSPAVAAVAAGYTAPLSQYDALKSQHFQYSRMPGTTAAASAAASTTSTAAHAPRVRPTAAGELPHGQPHPNVWRPATAPHDHDGDALPRRRSLFGVSSVTSTASGSGSLA